MAQISKKMRLAAYHEAGHAVACFQLGVRISEVSIIAEGNCLGFCSAQHALHGHNPEFDKTDSNRLRMEKCFVTLMAGFYAGKKLNPKGKGSAGASGDFGEAVSLVRYFISSSAEHQAYIDLLSIRARQLVNSRFIWPLISALAQRLLERKRMKGKEVREFLFAERNKILREHMAAKNK